MRLTDSLVRSISISRGHYRPESAETSHNSMLCVQNQVMDNVLFFIGFGYRVHTYIVL